MKKIFQMFLKVGITPAVTEEINHTTENIHDMSGRLLFLIKELN